MFTGIVQGMGRVIRLMRRGGGARLEVRAPGMLAGVKVGDSVAVNGACVTVTAIEGDAFACDLVPETLARTTLGMVQPNEEVNIERPLRVDGRLDGHMVQGHIDVVGVVRSRRKVGAQEMLEINVPFELTRYLAAKGSVCVDGVSLTVVDVNRDRFRVALIPHTLATTTLGRKLQGHTLNVEVDILSKYVERHIAIRAPRQQPTLAELVRMPLRDETGPVPAIDGPMSPGALPDAHAFGGQAGPAGAASGYAQSALASAPPPPPKHPQSPKVSSKPAAKPKAPQLRPFTRPAAAKSRTAVKSAAPGTGKAVARASASAPAKTVSRGSSTAAARVSKKPVAAAKSRPATHKVAVKSKPKPAAKKPAAKSGKASSASKSHR